ncbi:hypothetical protein CP061683_2195A, partial [Chlamydia psittaci 06-1683]
MPAVLKASPL